MKLCWHKWRYYSHYGSGSVFRVCLKCGFTQRWTDEEGWHNWKPKKAER